MASYISIVKLPSRHVMSGAAAWLLRDASTHLQCSAYTVGIATICGAALTFVVLCGLHCHVASCFVNSYMCMSRTIGMCIAPPSTCTAAIAPRTPAHGPCASSAGASLRAASSLPSEPVPRWPGRQLFAFVDFLLEVCATARTAAHGARVRTDCAVCVRSSRTAADALAADADAASGMRVRCPPVGRVTPRPALASPSLAQPRRGVSAVTQLPCNTTPV